jgi:tetratricopeptide (TPR) repeat protein
MHKSILVSILPFILVTATLATSNRDNETLERAHLMQLDIRQGNPTAAKPLVNMLEEAVAQSPNNANLWEALGNANMALQGTMYTGPMDIPALIKVGDRAREAYARSLALNPNKALVRAGHGMAQMVVSQLKGDGPGMAAGIEDMNAAIRQAPKSTAVRLTRGFTIIHLPPAMRDTPAVTEDLKFILDTAPGGRPEDVLHVLLGDVYAETGNFDAARAEYKQVTGASAFAAEQAKARLKTGVATPAEITLVRMGTGTNCAMCHARGTDN